MTIEEYQTASLDALTAIVDRLTEINNALKTRPASEPARATNPRTGDLNAPDEAWAKFPWPGFCDSKGNLAKYNEVVLGDSLRNDRSRKSLAWWADNYVPKPFKGRPPSQADMAFRAALDGAKAWLAKAGPAPAQATRRPEPTERQMANLPPEGTPEEDTPY